MSETSAPLRVLHLVDDMRVGGVARMLAVLTERLREDAAGRPLAHRLAEVSKRALRPPALDCDIVVCHLSAAWRRLPFLAAIAARRRLIIVEHSYSAAFERLYVPKPKRFHAMLRLAYGLAMRVIAVSRGQAAWMRRNALLPARKLAVIPPVTDLSPFLALPPPAWRPPLTLGMIGRFADQKGFDVVLEAFASSGTAARLKICGGGPMEAELRRRAKGLPTVEILPMTAAPQDFMAGCDAILMPSRYEPYGLVCQEARAAGRPVLVADVDGLPEQVKDSRFVLKGDRPEDWAAAIARLTATPKACLPSVDRDKVAAETGESLALWALLLST